MKQAIYYFVIFTALVGFGGCAAKKLPFDYDPAYDTSRLSSFTLRVDEAAKPDPLNEERIRSAIEKELFSKGYEEASALGDFTVLYGMILYKDRPSPITFGIGLGGISGNFAGSLSTAITPKHDEVSLFVRMADPKTNRIFWSSSITKKWSADPYKRREIIREAISQMLGRFPARGQKTEVEK